MTPSRNAWPSYVAIATVGYVVYGLGSAAPYVRRQLDLSDTLVGLHSTALAIGFVIAGAFAGRVARRIGELVTRAGGLALIAAAVVMLIAAPNVAATLGAGVLIGVGAGTTLGFANATMGAPGGSLSRLRLGRANVWAMVAAFTAPVLFVLGDTRWLGWWIGLVPALALAAICALDLRAGPRIDPSATAAETGSLPTAFWLAWAFVVASVAVEFCIVFWAATLVERRTDSATSDATLVAALFLAGMFVGRVGMSLGIGTTGDVRAPAAIGLIVTAFGAVVAWTSTLAVLSGLGLLVAGIGVSVLYPVGIAAALAAAPGHLAVAGARLTLATGTAILIAPLVLGAIADATGVAIGWGLVLVLAGVALALSRTLPRSAPAT